MNKFFVDSSALIALAKTNDDCHEEAKNFLENLEPPFQFITTDFILDEVATRLRDSLGAQKTVLFCQTIFESRLYKIHFIDKPLFLKALDKLKKYDDKILSFTDCSSFVVMEKFQLKTAFAFDDDFVKVGFETVP